MAGATYTIWVKEGNGKRPTQSSYSRQGGSTKPSQPKSLISAITQDKTERAVSYSRNYAKGAISVRTAQNLLNGYYGITGQQSKINQVNAVVGFGRALAAGAWAGGPLGAAVAGGLYLGNEALSYEINRIEGNAMAAYLKDQHQTSIQNGRGDYYRR